jgi:hypothetical protein
LFSSQFQGTSCNAAQLVPFHSVHCLIVAQQEESSVDFIGTGLRHVSQGLADFLSDRHDVNEIDIAILCIEIPSARFPPPILSPSPRCTTSFWSPKRQVREAEPRAMQKLRRILNP